MSSNKTNNVDPELLIKQVKSRPELWDKSSEHHKELNQRSAAWRDICMVLCPEYEKLSRTDKHMYARMVIKKWTNIRDAWKKSKAQNKNRRKLRPYLYHKHLKFLEKNLKKHKIVEQETDATTTQSFGDLENEDGEGEGDKLSSEDSDDISDYAVTNERESSIKGIGNKTKVEDFQESETSMIQFMDMKSLENQNDDNPHLCFFRGLLPMLNKLNDDETLEFQIGVIQHLQKVRAKARSARSELTVRTDAASSSLEVKTEFAKL